MTHDTQHDARRLLPQVALALCALLAAGHPLAWGKLSQGALKTIVSASRLEARPGRVRLSSPIRASSRQCHDTAGVLTSFARLLDRRPRDQT